MPNGAPDDGRENCFIMAIWIQNLIVLAAVLGCAAFIARGAVRSLQGRKSKLNACGSCGGCATQPTTPKSATPRTAFIPADLLISRSQKR
jgi:cytochrome c553